MRKIMKLFIDENIKTWKKRSTKILIIVILLALIGTIGLVQFIKYMNEKSNGSDIIDDWWRSDVEGNIKGIKASLETEGLDEETKQTLRNELEIYELALEVDTNPYNPFSYWKGKVLYEIKSLKSIEPDSEQISELTEILRANDYLGYIQFEKDEAKKSLDNGEITQKEYEDKMMIINLREDNRIGEKENEGNWKETIILQIEEEQRSLRTGIDQSTRKILTAEEKQDAEDSIKIYIHQIENNAPDVNYANNNYRMLFESLAPGFVIAMIAIMAIVIAGGEISSEISTGSIKFWALTPNKRWKILTAKILSVLFYIVVITLIMAILTIASGNLFFDGKGTEYLYVKNGEVHAIGNALYMIETYFAKIITVVLFALLAIMLSVITRNTAVAVSFSVATYIGNGIIMAILNMYIKSEWIRFVPFNNLNIYSKIFPNATDIMNVFGSTGGFATSTPLVFSIGVLAVCTILMLVTMYDSFNHRDII